jgi:hypothetical protein
VRHVSDRFAALLDANVLYPFLVRDVLLTLAEAGLYRALWTDQINEEWARALIGKAPERRKKIEETITVMNDAFPEAIVDNYEDLIRRSLRSRIEDRFADNGGQQSLDD